MISVTYGSDSHGCPFARGSLRVSEFDCISAVFSSLHNERNLAEFESCLSKDSPWLFWVNASRAESEGDDMIKLFGPIYEPDAYVEISRGTLRRIVADWKLLLRGSLEGTRTYR